MLWPKSGIPARAACKPVRLSVRRKGCGVMKRAPQPGAGRGAAGNSLPSGAWLPLRRWCWACFSMPNIDGVAIYDKEAAMQATVYLQGLSDFGDQVRMVDELIINE